MLVESALDVGPKLRKSIGRHASGKTLRRPPDGIVHVRFTGNAPGIGEEVAANNSHVAGIGGPEPAALSSR